MQQRFAILVDDVVANVVDAEPELAQQRGWVLAPTANIGDSYVDGAFVPGTPPIDHAIAEINRQRDEALLAGVEFEGALYHSDEPFRADLTDMLLGFDKGLLAGPQNIRTKANAIVQLTPQQILMLKLTLGQRRQLIFAASWAAKDALTAQQGG